MRRYGLVDIPDQASDIDAVPITRTLTINGTTYDLSADRSWTITGSSNNIYNTDGTLTSARTLTFGGFNLSFAGATHTNRFTSSGRILLGHTTESTYILDVQNSNSRFGGTTNYTVLYSQANGGGIGLFKSDILLSNLIQNELNISAGIATGDVISIYCSDTLVPGTVRPLCINGNGRETVFGSDTTSNTASSLVTMVSTTKGFLPPKMTSAQRTAISSPATGLIVYQTDSTSGLYLRGLSTWARLGSGSVTDVSVVTANGLAGTVATSTSTPAITLSTTITGILKGDGTSISAAVANTDYQSPITLTTSGTSGAATLISNTLNIPNYSSTATSGTYTPTASGTSNCTVGTIYKNQYLRIGDVVTVSGYVDVKPTNTTAVYYFTLDIPINNGIGAGTWASGNCTAYPDATIGLNVGIIGASTTTNRIVLIMNKANHTSYIEHYYHYTYRLIA
jgi:hypothetical protein